MLQIKCFTMPIPPFYFTFLFFFFAFSVGILKKRDDASNVPRAANLPRLRLAKNAKESERIEARRSRETAYIGFLLYGGGPRGARRTLADVT